MINHQRLPLRFLLFLGLAALPRDGAGQSVATVHQTTLGEAGQKTPEVSTEEVVAILAGGREPLLDVRSPEEFAIAHIPGSINLYEKEVELVRQRYSDKATRLVFYCNGPFCGKSKRLSEQLEALGYTKIRRYQLGLPVWRALGHTVQTDLGGFKYIFKGDKTAVYVDARGTAAASKGTVPGAVFVRAGEAEKANEDGRLPYKDKGTRVIVFADTPETARKVAEEIAGKAYWNSSYFGGTFADLKAANLW
ncbi:MAG: rhodanese-like domain-containing protein [Vicinamibacterales bacterium]